MNIKDKMRAVAPGDLLQEGTHARALWNARGVELTESNRMVSDAICAHVLSALWDNGFYEYLFKHPIFTVHEAAKELRLNRETLEMLAEYLLCRGILQKNEANQLELTDKGALLTNSSLRGNLNLYLEGFGVFFNNLGQLLRNELSLTDPLLKRSLLHVGMGTEQTTCVHIVPAVLRSLIKMNLRTVLDIGSGAGGFLIQLARLKKDLRGIGVDMSRESVEKAAVNAKQFSVADRLSFYTAKVGTDPLPIPKDIMDSVDVVTAMFILHELGSEGPEGIITFLKEIQQSFPGKLLIFLEISGLEPGEWDENGSPSTNFAAADYYLAHRVSLQGLPRKPAEWKKIVDQAGLKLIDMSMAAICGIYTVKL